MKMVNKGNKTSRVKTEGSGNGRSARKAPTVKKSPRAGKTLVPKAPGGNPDALRKPVPAGKPEAALSPSVAEKPKAGHLGFKKDYRSGNTCEVVFRLPKAGAPGARNVTIVGDFNGWDKESTPMRKLGNGDFTVTLELEAGRQYRFRYLIDGELWENDWHADKYVRSPYGADDSVVCV